MSAFELLGVSVFAGLLVVLLLGAARILWRWGLENLYLKVACRHVTDISGEWVSEYTDIHGNTCYEQTRLKQYGHKIEGTTAYGIVYKDRDSERHKTFRLRGLLRNDIFSA